ncbi:lamin tail domain-containing protein [Verrucomicrobiaceae bacterium N1E253]|uniref:Lamin tail domain-containing protein n=1 Tax=Oceaniferula marina TaxID=2748318 RepID=A0A851GHZ5_9BACT|nr:lamin tail domain-containing protein [Oceaniferula marina]NWK55491.1 lamin tail domain-containing protein [Oceaniferula marina]
MRFDINSGGSPTQPGWAAAPGGQGSDGTVSIRMDPVGAVVLDSRDRGDLNGGGAEASMWNDFVFASGSDSPGEGIRITLSGLQANSEYPITVWAFDDLTGGNATGFWNGEQLTFPDNPDPASLGDYAVSFHVTSDAQGEVAIQGLVGSPRSSGHNVFINGLEVGDRIAEDAPYHIELSSRLVNRAAAIGSLVGVLSSQDPDQEDGFIYTFAPGAGGDHNGLFSLQGNTLLTDRSLQSVGSTLSLKIQTTDREGNSYEKVFALVVIDDVDDDGLDDVWELEYFPSLSAARGSDHSDEDLLNNLEEQALGTNPTLSDTDADGLADHMENGSGKFVDADNAGSDPNLADSDGDGLMDGDEVSPANGSVTDPNLKDTDGDMYGDALEIIQGTSPTDADQFPDVALALTINEFVANNQTGVKDGYGNREDWIEIYNPNIVAVNLVGYTLTDDASVLNKWTFPEVHIPAGGYLLVMASGKNEWDPGGYLHTNFKLSAAGEYLALVRPQGQVIDDQMTPAFPEQFGDVSYARHPSSGTWGYASTPTPNQLNSALHFAGVVKDTRFSVDRGFYDQPFHVTIESDTPGAMIRYTTDGSKPSASHGSVYTGAISIETTTTLRAIAVRSGWLSTNVDSHSYFFVADVVNQPAAPPGWPATWTTAPADYAMDPRVRDGALLGYGVDDALLDIPTVSITMDPDDFLGSTNGIYSHPLNRWERECSVEYVLPDGGEGFQENCKVEIHGNSSRNPARMQKHSMRLTFSSEVGVPKLDFPLFADSPVNAFNKLVLRACFTDSWGLTGWSPSRYRPNDSQYLRDVWMKESFRDMGQPSSYGNFVHVYVNGLYFGLHNMTERLEDDFFASHLGGKEEDWEVYADFSSPGDHWQQLMSIANGAIETPETYQQIQPFLDIENYIDYMLLHFYADAEDWPHHNGYAAVNPVSGDGRYRFFVWDQEIALDKFSWNRYDNGTGGAAPFQRLRRNEEFLMTFADRVQKHLFNGGALSEESSRARYNEVASWIDKAIVAESARWGDTQDTTAGSASVSQPSPLDDLDHDAYPPAPHAPNIYFTREDSWLLELENVLNHYIPILHDPNDPRSIVRELRANQLFPSLDAPVLSQHGGDIDPGFLLDVTAKLGDIYYTLDGSDPRLPGGAVAPAAQFLAGDYDQVVLVALASSDWKYFDKGESLGASDIIYGHADYDQTDWKNPDFDDAAWSEGPAPLGYGVMTGGVINTVISYGGDATNKHLTSYFRKTFDVEEVSEIESLRIRLRRDDGAIVYLNGREIVRSNMPAGVVTFSSVATQGVGGSDESALFDFSYELKPGELLREGNVLAIEVHQSGGGSSDLGVDVEVVGVKRMAGSQSLELLDSARLQARAFSGGEWSALVQADFTMGQAASASNLVVSEIMYHPLDGTSYEYLELMNISSTAEIDLSGVRFALGITYTFPEGTRLAPRERCLVVEDRVAFEQYYGAGHPVVGQYEGKLANGGEQIILLGSGGDTIRNFSYGDQFPWPESADGGGYSLVLIHPESAPDHGSPMNWRASVALHGTPSGSDSSSFVGDPAEDRDGDGLGAFLEYALGGSDLIFSPDSLPRAGYGVWDDGSETGTTAEYLTFSFTCNLAADDVLYAPQISEDLRDWREGEPDLVLVARLNLGDGRETRTYRTADPEAWAEGSKKFIRLLLRQR